VDQGALSVTTHKESPEIFQLVAEEEVHILVVAPLQVIVSGEEERWLSSRKDNLFLGPTSHKYYDICSAMT